MRIVSLLPSATEIVYSLGLGDALVGVSHECDFPPDAKTRPKMIEPVFDTSELDSDRINQLVTEYTERGERLYKIKVNELKKAKPDLIITQELCDVCAIGAEDVLAAVSQLERPANILSLNPHSLTEIEDDIRKVGVAAGLPDRAERVVVNIQGKMHAVRAMTESASRLRVFCVEWLKPLMNAGHWVPEMVDYAGGVEGLANRGKPSRYVDWTSVLSYDPEVIVLMPCGLTTPRTLVEARHLFELKDIRRISAVQGGRVYATDGHNFFSRSGPRLCEGVQILAQMIHPELFSEPLDPEHGMRVDVLEATH